MVVTFKKGNTEIMKDAIESIRKRNVHNPLFKGDIPEKSFKDGEKATESFVKRHEDTACNIDCIDKIWKNVITDFEKLVELELGTATLTDFKQKTITVNVTGIDVEPHSTDCNTIIVQDNCDWYTLLHELLHTVLKQDDKAHPKIKELLNKFRT